MHGKGAATSTWPSGVRALRVGVGLVAVGDVLGDVFGQVADAPVRVLGPGQHALGVELRAEPGHVQRIIGRADASRAWSQVGTEREPLCVKRFWE
jgi:hypothetical protein